MGKGSKEETNDQKGKSREKEKAQGETLEEVATCMQKHLGLNINKADMRQIPFSNETFGCVFSWNSSVHLTKKILNLQLLNV